MIQLSDPTYLWALAGLLIPLVIHLLNRKAGKVVRVGSIRHLIESNTRRFSSIRFNEYLLFALRAVSIIIFVLLLTGLTRDGSKVVPKWVLIEAGAETALGLEKSLDSLREAGYEFRYFAEGFPLMGEGTYDTEPVNYPYFIKQLQEAQVEAIIYAKNRLNAFKGRQLSLPENISWLQIPTTDREELYKASRLQKDTVALLTGKTGPVGTEFSRQLQFAAVDQNTINGPKGETITIDREKIDSILLIAPKEYEKDAAILAAAIGAISKISKRRIVVSKAVESFDLLAGYHCIISFEPGFSTVNEETKLISFQEQPASRLLVQTGHNTWQLSRRLNRQVAVKENLPIVLAQILLQDEELEQTIRAWDQRMIDESVFFTRDRQLATRIKTQRKPLDNWLIFFLILVVITERIVAFSKTS